MEKEKPKSRDEIAREKVKAKNVVIYGATIGKSTGNSKLITHMAHQLKDKGHNVFAIGMEYNGPQLNIDGIPLFPGFFCEFCGTSHKGHPTNMQKVADMLRLLQTDVLICVGDPYHMQQMGIGNLNLSTGRTIMYATIDSEGMFCNNVLTDNGMRSYMDYCDKVIATSKYSQEQLKEAGIDSELIHEAIDLEDFKPVNAQEKENIRKKHRFKKDDFIMFYCGRNIMRKRHNDLLDAAAKLICETDNTYLYCSIPPTVIGTKSYYPDVLNPFDFIERVLNKKYGRNLLKEGRIIFIGREGLGSDIITEKEQAELYSLSDLYVTTTGGEGFGLCVPPETKIITKEGTLPISFIRKGDKVLTHTGKFRTVKEIMERPVNEKIIEIKGYGLPSIKLTKEHPVYAVKRPNKKYKKSLGNSIINSRPEWIEAGKLKKGDLLVMNGIRTRKSCFPYDLSEFDPSLVHTDEYVFYHMGYSKYSKKAPVKYKRYITLDSRLSYLLGWYAAEGSASGGSIEFSLHKKEAHYSREIKEIMKEKFGVERFTEIVNGNRRRLIFSGRILQHFFSDVCGKGARNKKMPKEIIESYDDSFAAEFIRGLFYGDGYKKDNFHELVTSSETLAHQVMMKLISLGLAPTWKKHQNNAHKIRTTIKEGITHSNKTWQNGINTFYLIKDINKI